jgi:hypothetical protein
MEKELFGFGWLLKVSKRYSGRPYIGFVLSFHQQERSTKSNEIGTKKTFRVGSWIVLLGMGISK